MRGNRNTKEEGVRRREGEEKAMLNKSKCRLIVWKFGIYHSSSSTFFIFLFLLFHHCYALLTFLFIHLSMYLFTSSAFNSFINLFISFPISIFYSSTYLLTYVFNYLLIYFTSSTFTSFINLPPYLLNVSTFPRCVYFLLCK